MWSNTIAFYIFFKKSGKIGWKDHTKIKDISSLLVLYEIYLIVRAKLLCNVFDTFKSWKMTWLSKKHNSLHKKKPRIYNFDKLLVSTKAQT
jgi:hypothetical protein